MGTQSLFFSLRIKNSILFLKIDILRNCSCISIIHFYLSPSILLMGKRSTLYHLFFWGFVFLYSFVFHLQGIPEPNGIWHPLVLTGLDIFFFGIVFYTNLYILIPRVLKKIGIVAYSLLTITFLILVFNVGLLSPLFEGMDIQKSSFLDLNFLSEAFFYIADLSLFVLISLLYYFFTQHRLEKERALQFQNDKLNAQLHFLRSQISPHFLFNSLNNIYSLIIQNDDNASLMVEKIATMLRYIIYEGENKKVAMDKEITLIENYIDLQFLKKMKNAEQIEYTKNGNFSEKEIVPLLLMNCVENCFKHSNLETNPDGVLHINLSERDNKFILHTKNSYSARSSKKNKSSFQYLRQQLNHHYPNRHSFFTSDKKGVFTFELTLELL